jgi:hypothetical protein
VFDVIVDFLTNMFPFPFFNKDGVFTKGRRVTIHTGGDGRPTERQTAGYCTVVDGESASQMLVGQAYEKEAGVPNVGDKLGSDFIEIKDASMLEKWDTLEVAASSLYVRWHESGKSVQAATMGLPGYNGRRYGKGDKLNLSEVFKQEPYSFFIYKQFLFPEEVTGWKVKKGGKKAKA